MMTRRAQGRARADVPPELVAQAWTRIDINARRFARRRSRSALSDAQQVGFLESKPDLSRLVRGAMTAALLMPADRRCQPAADAAVARQPDAIRVKASRSGSARRAPRCTRSTTCRSTSSEGEFVCLVGPSGCGKSTLLNLVAGLDQARRRARARRRQAGHGPGPRPHGDVPGVGAVPVARRAAATCMFGLKLKPGLTQRRRREIARCYLELVGLERFAQPTSTSSRGGMRQRVALARALAPEPARAADGRALRARSTR